MSETFELPRDLVFLHCLMRENGYLHARPIGGGLYACIRPLMFTHAIITGRIGNTDSFEDQWCYRSRTEARLSLDAWNGVGEPNGWHRHPATGRRLAETVDCRDGYGRLVPIGTIYTQR